MFTQRIEKVRTILKEKNCEAVLITNFYNILYLTGCKTISPHEREAYVFITQDAVYFLSDGRYDVAIQAQIKELKSDIIFKLISAQNSLLNHLAEIIKTAQVKTLGFESNDVTVGEYNRLQQTFSMLAFVPLETNIAQLKSIKDEFEITQIRTACQIIDKCLAEIITHLKLGMKEKEIAYMFERWIRENGYDIAFEPMVAFDANAALPHYHSKFGEGILKQGSIMLIDFGIKYNDYVSDISRMFFVGNPSDEIKKTYESLLHAQNKTVAAIGTAAKTLKDINDLCRKYIQEIGLPDFSHAVGHGLGLEVHEQPVISFFSAERISPQQVFTIEPGIYIPQSFGMRIEDTVVIKEDGTAESLTKFPKELMILQVV